MDGWSSNPRAGGSAQVRSRSGIDATRRIKTGSPSRTRGGRCRTDAFRQPARNDRATRRSVQSGGKCALSDTATRPVPEPARSDHRRHPTRTVSTLSNVPFRNVSRSSPSVHCSDRSIPHARLRTRGRGRMRAGPKDASSLDADVAGPQPSAFASRGARSLSRVHRAPGHVCSCEYGPIRVGDREPVRNAG